MCCQHAGSWWTGSAVDMGIVEEVPDPTDVKVYADPNSTAAKKAAASASDHVLLAQLVSQVSAASLVRAGYSNTRS